MNQTKDEKKMNDMIIHNTTKCMCSHSVFMPVYLDKTTCSYCGRTVYNKTKEHFMYKLKKEMKK